MLNLDGLLRIIPYLIQDPRGRALGKNIGSGREGGAACIVIHYIHHKAVIQGPFVVLYIVV